MRHWTSMEASSHAELAWGGCDRAGVVAVRLTSGTGRFIMTLLPLASDVSP